MREARLRPEYASLYPELIPGKWEPASRIVEVEVNWPASGTRQVFADVPKNQVIEIREMTDRFATLDRKPLPLGGRRAR